MRKLKFVFMFILIIGLNQINGREVNVISYPKEKEYYQIYEFHNGFIKIIQNSVYESNNYGFFGNPDFILNNKPENIDLFFSGPSQYDTSDLYDISYPQNLMLTGKKFTNDNWRGTVYYNPKFRFIYNDTSNISENFSAWLSFKLKRIPALHTRQELIPDKEFHLGINTAPHLYLQKNVRILAFPPETKINEIFHHMPTKQETFKGWTLLIYDLSSIEDNVGFHVKFILSQKDSLELTTNEISQIFSGVSGKKDL